MRHRENLAKHGLSGASVGSAWGNEGRWDVELLQGHDSTSTQEDIICLGRSVFCISVGQYRCHWQHVQERREHEGRYIERWTICNCSCQRHRLVNGTWLQVSIVGCRNTASGCCSCRTHHGHDHDPHALWSSVLALAVETAQNHWYRLHWPPLRPRKTTRAFATTAC
ncbi:hypothetical protein BC828DRAFT_380494 [Blastocladiella britannica]|nr:hypothetical protein BC828DRAFT_380494 [Blastocladiella britannica]